MNPLERLVNRTDCYWQMHNGGYQHIKESLTLELLNEHLGGKRTIGGATLDKQNKVKYICWDVDDANNINQALEKAKKIYNELVIAGYEPILEFSGSKGFHVWILCKPVDAYCAKIFGERIVKQVRLDGVEVFPKQTKLTEDRPFGNFVKLPLGKHLKSDKWSYFIKNGVVTMKQSASLELLYRVREAELPVIEKPKFQESESGSCSGKPKRCPFLEYACESKLKEGARNQSLAPNLMAMMPERAGEFAKVQEMGLSDVIGWKGKAEFNCKQLQKFAGAVEKRSICDICLLGGKRNG